MPTPPKSLKSHLLIAAPELQDPNFVHTVVLLIEHGENGALGVVLNRPLDRPISDLWKQISDTPTDCQAPCFWGGPVAGPLIVLHRIEGLSEIEVAAGVYFTANKDDIDEAMKRQGADLRFYIGCAGWSTGQLESEIDEGSWRCMPASVSHIFDGTSELWADLGEQLKFDNVIEQFGVKHDPPDPSLN